MAASDSFLLNAERHAVNWNAPYAGQQRSSLLTLPATVLGTTQASPRSHILPGFDTNIMIFGQRLC